MQPGFEVTGSCCKITIPAYPAIQGRLCILPSASHLHSNHAKAVQIAECHRSLMHALPHALMACRSPPLIKSSLQCNLEDNHLPQLHVFIRSHAQTLHKEAQCSCCWAAVARRKHCSFLAFAQMAPEGIGPGEHVSMLHCRKHATLP